MTNHEHERQPETVATLVTEAHKAVEEMVLKTNAGWAKQSVAYDGWKNREVEVDGEVRSENLPIFKNRPQFDVAEVDGVLIGEIAPAAAELFRIDDESQVDFGYSGPCYEVDALGADPKYKPAQVTITILRPDGYDIVELNVDSTLNAEEPSWSRSSESAGNKASDLEDEPDVEAALDKDTVTMLGEIGLGDHMSGEAPDPSAYRINVFGEDHPDAREKLGLTVYHGGSVGQLSLEEARGLLAIAEVLPRRDSSSTS